jgi:hypothetical protein
MTLPDQMKQLPHLQYTWTTWGQVKNKGVTLENVKESPMDSEFCLSLQTGRVMKIVAGEPTKDMHAKDSDMVRQLFKHVTKNMEQLKVSHSNVCQRTISLLYTSNSL